MSPLIYLGIALGGIGIWLIIRLITASRARILARTRYLDAVKPLFDGGEARFVRIAFEDRRAQDCAGSGRRIFSASIGKTRSHTPAVHEPLDIFRFAGKRVRDPLIHDKNRAMLSSELSHRCENSHRVGHVVDALEGANEVELLAQRGRLGTVDAVKTNAFRESGLRCVLCRDPHGFGVGVETLDCNPGVCPCDANRGPPAAEADFSDTCTRPRQ